MKITLTGADGQLGRALQGALQGDQVEAVDLPEFDITDGEQVGGLLRARTPDIVINCAGYTDVDGCVSDYAAAHRANALGPMNLAVECRRLGIALLHVSTNEVFDGRRREGYEEWMPVNPINHYGMSKAAGEFNVRSVLPEHYMVRTAWLFAEGGRNFVHAILKKARETGGIRVVTDELGNPTYAKDLAEAISRLIRTGQYGTYHLVGSGGCSRWEFANLILRAAGLEEVTNEPISSDQFERVSTPPANGILLNRTGAAIGISLRPWQEAVEEFVHETLNRGVSAGDRVAAG